MKEKILGKKIRLMSSRGKKHAPIVSEARRRLEGRMEGMMTGGLRTHRGIIPMKTNGNIKKRARRPRIIL